MTIGSDSCELLCTYTSTSVSIAAHAPPGRVRAARIVQSAIVQTVIRHDDRVRFLLVDMYVQVQVHLQSAIVQTNECDATKGQSTYEFCDSESLTAKQSGLAYL